MRYRCSTLRHLGMVCLACAVWICAGSAWAQASEVMRLWQDLRAIKQEAHRLLRNDQTADHLTQRAELTEKAMLEAVRGIDPKNEREGRMVEKAFDELAQVKLLVAGEQLASMQRRQTRPGSSNMQR